MTQDSDGCLPQQCSKHRWTASYNFERAASQGASCFSLPQWLPCLCTPFLFLDLMHHSEAPALQLKYLGPHCPGWQSLRPGDWSNWGLAALPGQKWMPAHIICHSRCGALKILDHSFPWGRCRAGLGGRACQGSSGGDAVPERACRTVVPGTGGRCACAGQHAWGGCCTLDTSRTLWQPFLAAAKTSVSTWLKIPQARRGLI